jgi:hypothetical protein
MRPFKWLLETLNRTRWWMLWAAGLLLIALFAAIAFPTTLMVYQGTSDSADEVVKRELSIAFGREAMKSMARAAARVRSGVPEDAEELINTAISDWADAQIELKAAQRLGEQAATSQEKSAAKEAEDAARKYVDATALRLTHVAQTIFGSSDAVRFDAESEKTFGVFSGADKQKDASKGVERQQEREQERAERDRTRAEREASKAAKQRERAEKETAKANAAQSASSKVPKGVKPDPPSAPPAPVAPTPATTPIAVIPPIVPGVPGMEATRPENRLTMLVSGSLEQLSEDGQFTDSQRAELDQAVRFDMAKIILAIVMIPVIFVLLVLLSVIKFYAGRALAAQRVAQVSKEEAERIRLREQVTQARLQALQAQVEPHFLYNTLANVQALTEIDPPAANKMVGHLIEYLRAALPKMRESSSTVGQELELARAYLNILQMRMGKRLVYEIAVPQALLSLPFPPMMLPSLVENAIKHGLEPVREGGSLIITAALINTANGDRLRMIVTDTGKGLSEGIASTAGTGVGLSNIRERLQGLYGNNGTLALEANSPRGVVSTIEIPAGMSAQIMTSSAHKELAEKPAAPVFPETAPTGAWAKTWYYTRVVDRYWRKAMRFLFIMLVVASAVVCVGGLISVITGGSSIAFGPLQTSGTVAGALLAFVMFLGVFIALVVACVLVVVTTYLTGWILVLSMIGVVLSIVISVFGPIGIALIIVGGAAWLIYRYVKSRDHKHAEAMQSKSGDVTSTTSMPAVAQPAPTQPPAQ